MRVRPEPFGAWVSLSDATLLAVDRPLAAALGVDGGALWAAPPEAHPDPTRAPGSPPSAPLEAHVAVTHRCAMGCSGCYQSAVPHGEDVPFDALVETLDALSSAGVFTVAFGGGEPLVRDDLGALAREARARGLIPVVTTSGAGLTPERALSLRDFAQVNVSHDGVSGGYALVRGFDAEVVADRAILALVGAGVPVGVNHVLTRQNLSRLEATAAHVLALGARELQLLRYKPSGRAASPEYLARRLTPEQSRTLGAHVRALCEAHPGALSVRVDCALVPLLVDSLGEASTLARFGVFGCEAGRHLVAVRRDGALAPCSFSEPSNGHTRDFLPSWASQPALEVFRRFVEDPLEPCAGCSWRLVCRGGCKVVSEHLGEGFGPDPECPRVIEWRSSRCQE